MINTILFQWFNPQRMVDACVSPSNEEGRRISFQQVPMVALMWLRFSVFDAILGKEEVDHNMMWQPFHSYLSVSTPRGPNTV